MAADGRHLTPPENAHKTCYTLVKKYIFAVTTIL